MWLDFGMFKGQPKIVSICIVPDFPSITIVGNGPVNCRSDGTQVFWIRLDTPVAKAGFVIPANAFRFDILCELPRYVAHLGISKHTEF